MEDIQNKPREHKKSGFVVVTRREKQGVHINVNGVDVEVFVRTIKNKMVMLAVRAPRECRIERIETSIQGD